MWSNQKGQTLLEMIVVITVGIIIIGALTFATIASLRNANLAKNQTQATKLAQEGMEKVRTIRDRGIDGSVTYLPTNVRIFIDLFTAADCSNGCYFTLVDNGTRMVGGTTTSFEVLDEVFKRQVVVTDDGNEKEKIVTVTVEWIDARGEKHTSRLSTILINKNESF